MILFDANNKYKKKINTIVFQFNTSLFFFFIIIQSAFSQIATPNTLAPFYTETNLKIDGNLSDSVWQLSQKISNFTQRELVYGEPSTEKTEVAVAYNKDFLYVAVWCYDKAPNKIIAKEFKRDFDYSLDDNFIIIIDTYNDLRNGFMFITNPNGARADLQVFNNGGSTNTFWNGVWNVKTTRNDSGWFAEFEIPMYTFKYKNGQQTQDWGINFERNIRHKREQVRWQGFSRNYKIEQVSQAGKLVGLQHLRSKIFTEIKPYGIAGAEKANNKNNFLKNAGGDINYLLSPSYRLNVTFNTDFAQVESDQQQVNLTRFPLFFPELREFFLEGEDYFNMGFGGNRIVPFYSRRIGLDSLRQSIPIIAGARLLGKQNDNTLGLMSMQTAATDKQNTTNYTVASWRRDVGKQSVIGAMSSNRLDYNAFHSTTGINGRYSTSQFMKNKNLDIGGAYIHTYNNNLGFNKMAFAYRTFISYQNDIVSIFASNQRSPEAFNPEVGLMRRTKFRESFLQLAVKPRPKNKMKWVRQFEFIPAAITFAQYDDTKKIQSFEYQLRLFGMDTKKGDKISIDYKRLAEGLINDFEIAPGIIIPSKTYWWNQLECEAASFTGRTLSFKTKWIAGQFYGGNSLQQSSAALWRASKYLNVNLIYGVNYVDLPQGEFNTHLFSTRLEYAINANAFGAVLAQYSSAQEQLIMNFRLRLIPKIGTDFYLIVNQVYGNTLSQFESDRTTVLGKLIWRFTI